MQRWRGVRPTVRGVAMNPVDHPHGGGEGKTSEEETQYPLGELQQRVTEHANLNRVTNLLSKGGINNGKI